jgi:hypothetical protein
METTNYNEVVKFNEDDMFLYKLGDYRIIINHALAPGKKLGVDIQGYGEIGNPDDISLKMLFAHCQLTGGPLVVCHHKCEGRTLLSELKVIAQTIRTMATSFYLKQR